MKNTPWERQSDLLSPTGVFRQGKARLIIYIYIYKVAYPPPFWPPQNQRFHPKQVLPWPGAWAKPERRWLPDSSRIGSVQKTHFFNKKYVVGHLVSPDFGGAKPIFRAFPAEVHVLPVFTLLTLLSKSVTYNHVFPT